MSRLGRLRKKVNYETDIPRCQTCVHFRKSRIFLKNSIPIKSQAMCHKHEFTAAPMAVCDDWKDSKGNTLEKLPLKTTKTS